jgi:hypothetical protein
MDWDADHRGPSSRSVRGPQWSSDTAIVVAGLVSPVTGLGQPGNRPPEVLMKSVLHGNHASHSTSHERPRMGPHQTTPLSVKFRTKQAHATPGGTLKSSLGVKGSQVQILSARQKA